MHGVSFTTHVGHVMPGHIHATHVVILIGRSGTLCYAKRNQSKNESDRK
jgi:quercetin dioxygenase-like cupin family protein